LFNLDQKICTWLATRSLDVTEVVFNLDDGVDYSGLGRLESLDIAGGGSIVDKARHFAGRVPLGSYFPAQNSRFLRRTVAMRLKRRLGVDLSVSHLEGAYYVDEPPYARPGHRTRAATVAAKSGSSKVLLGLDGDNHRLWIRIATVKVSPDRYSPQRTRADVNISHKLASVVSAARRKLRGTPGNRCRARARFRQPCEGRSAAGRLQRSESIGSIECVAGD
jgi:hypothetical protein